MPTLPAFVLPKNLKLDIRGDSLDIAYDGDVELHQDLGLKLGKVRVGGNLTLRLAKITGDIEAGGLLTIHGEVASERLHAAEIILGREPIKSTSISAATRITIGAAALTVDAIVAPEINLDPKASGRVTVIESHNERGATKIKGGFSLGDYDDMFGNATEFLAERGLSPLDGSALPTARPAEERSPEPAPEPEPVEEDDDEEDTDDPLSLSIDDMEPLTEEGPGDDEVQKRLTDALKRIVACYSSGDLPPAVGELRLLVEDGDRDALRQNIPEVWNGLLRFQQMRGEKLDPRVTHAFNTIHGIVQG